MPKIFVQGEIGADRRLRRDAAHCLEMGDAHGDAIACILVSEGIGEPEFGSMVACEILHEVIAWTEDNITKIVREADYELDSHRLVAELAARIALEQMRRGDANGMMPIHFAYLVAYKGEYFALRVGEAKMLRIGANECFEVGFDPKGEHTVLAQTTLATEPKYGSLTALSYELHIGRYEEGDLFLAMTPGLWDRLGEDGLVQAYANHLDMDEESLSEFTAGLIFDAGEFGGAAGLSMAGAEMVSYTPYQKLGVKVS